MLYNPDTKSLSRKNTIGLIVFILITVSYFSISHYQRKQARSEIRAISFSGIITSYEYMTGHAGYYYYTNKGDFIQSYYFFYNYNTEIQLNIGDSIYKAPDSFKLYIYKKDSEGKYVFDRLAQIHDDSY